VYEVASAYARVFSSDCYQWLKDLVEPRVSQANVVTKARQEKNLLGSKVLEVYQLPDGSYLLSQTKSAEAVDEDEVSFRRFLGSNSPEALPYKGFRSDKLAVEGNNAKINGVPMPLTVAYWTKEAASGNPTAARLLSGNWRRARWKLYRSSVTLSRGKPEIRIFSGLWNTGVLTKNSRKAA